MKPILFLLIIALSPSIYGQVDYQRKHWVFGKNASISFDNAGITTVTTSPLDGYEGSACYSNKQGELVLSTNGNAIYGKNNELLSLLFTGLEKNTNPDALIIPKNDEETKFYIFINQAATGLRVVDVDIELKTVELRPNVLHSGRGHKLTAVKHCFSDAYWLIFPDAENSFYSFLVKSNSISEPVVSSLSRNRGHHGDFVSSHDGTKLALSSYLGDWAEIYDFDKKCGTISNPRDLRKAQPEDNRPHGISFSPDDLSVYVAWSLEKSNLYQYDLENWGSISNAVSSQENINDVLLGIDGNLYLNVHDNGNPSRRIDVVRNPNAKAGGGTRAIKNIATLPVGTNAAFEFPTFISSNTGGECMENGDFSRNNFLVNDNRCTDNQVFFSATIVDGTYDSIRWDWNSGIVSDYQFNHNSQLGLSSHSYKLDLNEERRYAIRCFAFHCSFIDTFYLPIDMKHPVSFSIGNDSTLCFGKDIEISIPQPFDTFMWEDGHRESSRIEESGTFIAAVSVQTCILRDTITIDHHPDIWTELNQEYFICDLEEEATKLDAGSGFEQYKWTPTGDTTQWIIVEELGEYIVVVDAFNGCQESNNTFVKRRCDLSYHIPNAFSPNGDNLNDVFSIVGENIEKAELSIYNRWGELIFKGESWDGKNCQSGVYFYTATIRGYRKRIPVEQNTYGIIHLVR